VDFSSFLAALLLLACWPAHPSFSSSPGASLGHPSHGLLLLGSCDDILELFLVFLMFLAMYAQVNEMEL
jgi:hypothetical protein